MAGDWIAVLPEVAETGQGKDVETMADWSYPLEGAVQDTFAREARKCLLRRGFRLTLLRIGLQRDVPTPPFF